MNALTPELTALLQAVVAALDVPLADQAEDDQARAELLSQRASDVRVILDSVLKHPFVEDCTEQLRAWTAERPVTFPSWQDRRQQTEPADLPDVLVLPADPDQPVPYTVTVRATQAGVTGSIRPGASR